MGCGCRDLLAYVLRLESNQISAELEKIFANWTNNEMLEFYKTTRCVIEVGNGKLVLKGFFEEDKICANQRLSQIAEYEQMHSRHKNEAPKEHVAAAVAVPQPPAGNERVILQIPTSQGGLIIGKGGRTLRILKHKSGAEIRVMPKGEITTIEIIGSLECVAAACKAVVKLIKSSEILRERAFDNFSTEVVRKIQSWTVYEVINFYVEIGAFVETSGDTLVVKGFTEDSINQADSRLQTQFSQTTNPIKSPAAPEISGIERIEMRMPRSQGGIICGKGGLLLKQLMNETGTALNFKTHVDELETSILQLSGPPDCVALAELAVYSRLERSNILKTKIFPEAHCIVSAWQQKDTLDFYKETGCFLQIGGNTLVLKYFNQENLFLAEQKLNQLVDQNQSNKVAPRVLEIDVHKSLAGLIIGIEGAMVKNIQEQTQTKISIQREVADEAQRKVRIEGAQEGISAAKAAIDRLVSKAEQTKTSEALTELNCNDIAPVVNPMLELWDPATLMTFQRDTCTTIYLDFTFLEYHQYFRF